MHALLMSYLYENFELYNPTLTLELIVWSVCAGIVIGAVTAYLQRAVIGAFARRLIADGIDTPEKAVTVEEAGFGKNFLVKLALREGGSLRRTVTLANAEDFPPKAASKGGERLRRLFSMDEEPRRALDLTRARFYIPEEDRIRAELKYEIKGTTLGGLAVSIVLVIAIGFAALYILPELFQFLDNFLTSIRS